MGLLLGLENQRSLRSTLTVTGAASFTSTLPTLVPLVSCHSIPAFFVFVSGDGPPLLDHRLLVVLHHLGVGDPPTSTPLPPCAGSPCRPPSSPRTRRARRQDSPGTPSRSLAPVRATPAWKAAGAAAGAGAAPVAGVAAGAGASAGRRRGGGCLGRARRLSGLLLRASDRQRDHANQDEDERSLHSLTSAAADSIAARLSFEIRRNGPSGTRSLSPRRLACQQRRAALQSAAHQRTVARA